MFFALVVLAFSLLRKFLWTNKQPAVALSEDAQAINYYAKKWKYVAREAGLAQQPAKKELNDWQAAYIVQNGPTTSQKIRAVRDASRDMSIVPELLSIEPAPLGYTHTVELLPGQTAETFAKRAAVMADLWRVPSVRVVQEVPGQVLLTPVVNNPMADIEPITHENYRSHNASVHSVRIGALEDGTPWEFPLGVHSIVAGNSGGGKSVCYRAILSQMALTPDLEIVGIDLKRGIELKSWRPRLSVTAKDWTKHSTPSKTFGRLQNSGWTSWWSAIRRYEGLRVQPRNAKDRRPDR